MSKRQETKVYNFSVEGKTEIYYLEWLEKAINGVKEKTHKVKFNIRKDNPFSYAKNLIARFGPKEVIHIVDYEGNDDEHIKRFQKTLFNMKKAKTELKNKIAKYYLGYTNLTFELWIILHKMECFNRFNYRGQYLDKINECFGKKYESLDEYKKEKEFKKLMEDLTIKNVKDAIKRSRKYYKRK